MPPMSGIPSNTLIPLNYNLVPTRRTTGEGGAMTESMDKRGRQQHAPQRQVVVRRFHFDSNLTCHDNRLVTAIFVFNQDGSKQRLALLLVFAALVYFYQTGALTPLI
ncbi:hypothetical protein IFM89_024182 [Coptis chinensis]|uniref:Uncharacterized protein n=1 Tax=Coptis chinensis TaxID=261450 RepID=A0A835H625_9MAGN|nr:hypothetical protein IFM89_024182 [Coptis chinensis]